MDTSFNNTTCVVTGGAGFIGSHLARALCEQEARVRIVDTFVAGRHAGRQVPEAEYHEVDVTDHEGLLQCCAGADYIFHLAALPRVQDSIDHPLATMRTNVNGTASVLAAAWAVGANVIFSSSAAVYGDSENVPLQETMPVHPKSPYGLHKYEGERMCALWSELYDVPTIALRYFNVYGSGFDPNGPYALVVGRFLDLKKRGEPLTIAGDGTHTRDYVHVVDVVRANMLAAQYAGGGDVVNIGSGVETSVNELAALVGGETTAAPPRIEPARSVADVSKAKDVLNWQPEIPLAEGIRALKESYGV